MTHGIALLVVGITLVVVSFILVGRQAEKSVDAAVEAASEAAKARAKARAEMPRRDRIAGLKNFYLYELVEDPIDGTPFDTDVLRALEELERRYINE